MKASMLARASVNALRVRFTGARKPLAARIQVTRRCTSRCAYCKLPDEDGDALSTGDLGDILRQLASLGCLRVSFSGGEPMMRDDIGSVISTCASLDMAPEMNSSGAGLASRIDEIGALRLLKLSLDGPPEVHDAVRGRRGSHAEVVSALEAARAREIRTVLVTTITRHNVRHLQHVLDLARDHGAYAAFQPFKPYYKGLVEARDLLPDSDDMRRAVATLARSRESGLAGVLRNSPAGLAHISRWPDYGPLRCWAGRIFCIVGADGTLYPCDRTRLDAPLPNVLDTGLERALHRLPDPECEGCGFCGALELNFAMALDRRVLGTIWKLIS